MLNLDPAKLLVIAVIAVLLLGPDKLPHAARQAGQAWRTFCEFRRRMEDEVRKSVPDLPSSADLSRLTRSPTALLDHLSHMAGDSAATASRDAEPRPEAAPARAVLETSHENSPASEISSAELSTSAAAESFATTDPALN